MYDRDVVIGKDDRQQAVAELARRGHIRTQADFLKALRAQRIRVDQSTLSRDLAELNVRKAGGYYVIAAPADNGDGDAGLDYAAAVRRFTTCGPHLIVVTTGVGQAPPVAVRIEEANEPAITATLAGDDTIFVATKNRRTQVVALRRLKQWFGDKHEP